LPAGAYVFARDPVGKFPWHPDGATQRFAALRKKLKLDGVRLHDLRHWMATEGLGGGADIETVAGRAGWANSTTPLQVYSHTGQQKTPNSHDRSRNDSTARKRERLTAPE